MRDTSLRLPPGVAGTVVEVRVFNRHGIDIDDRTRAIQNEEIERLKKDREDERGILNRATYDRLREMLLGQAATAAPKGIKKGAEIDADTARHRRAPRMVEVRGRRRQRQAELEAVKGQYDEAVKRRSSDKFEDRTRSSSAATSCPRACSRWSRCSSR